MTYQQFQTTFASLRYLQWKSQLKHKLLRNLLLPKTQNPFYVFVNIVLFVWPRHVIVAQLFSSCKTYYVKIEWKIRRNPLIIKHDKPLLFDWISWYFNSSNHISGLFWQLCWYMFDLSGIRFYRLFWAVVIKIGKQKFPVPR